MIYEESRETVEQARKAFTKKWRLRCPAVVRSLEEAGEELFTFLAFPPAQRKSPYQSFTEKREGGSAT